MFQHHLLLVEARSSSPEKFSIMRWGSPQQDPLTTRKSGFARLLFSEYNSNSSQHTNNIFNSNLERKVYIFNSYVDVNRTPYSPYSVCVISWQVQHCIWPLVKCALCLHQQAGLLPIFLINRWPGWSQKQKGKEESHGCYELLAGQRPLSPTPSCWHQHLQYD